MPWYHYLAHFFAGAFLANGVPHFVQGICGNKFQSPFASPPGAGESSAIVNVLWGFFNFIVAGALLRYFFPPLPRRSVVPSPRHSACWSWRCGLPTISAKSATAHRIRERGSSQ